jgi:hypothetical protein
MLAAQLLDRILESPVQTRLKVRAFLSSIDMDPTEGIDLADVPEEALAVLHLIVFHHRPYVPVPEDATPRLRAYRARIARSTRDDLKWLFSQVGKPTRALVQRQRVCTQNGWTVYGPTYVRPSLHYGETVGLGLFAMAPLTRGQMIHQFTGRMVHVTSAAAKKAYVETNDRRMNYCIEMVHGGHEYVVNPLDARDEEVDARYPGAYINEPSPPPWKTGDVVRHSSGRNAVVRKYNYKTATYTLEFSDGRTRAVPLEEVAWHPLHDQSHQPLVSRANCWWFDFPVPLTGLYDYSHINNGGLQVHVRTDSHQCVLTYTHSELVASVALVSDLTELSPLTRARVKHLYGGCVVVLHDEVHRGLKRYGYVTKVTPTTVSVLHLLDPGVGWRLPTRVLATKGVRCAACQTKDDPRCAACRVVPFPTIHVCADVAADTELLCLYSTPIHTRGAACAAVPTEEDLGPTWTVV